MTSLQSFPVWYAAFVLGFVGNTFLIQSLCNSILRSAFQVIIFLKSGKDFDLLKKEYAFLRRNRQRQGNTIFRSGNVTLHICPHIMVDNFWVLPHQPPLRAANRSTTVKHCIGVSISWPWPQWTISSLCLPGKHLQTSFYSRIYWSQADGGTVEYSCMDFCS